jgi:membrane peptidoglycan carboxypeptidase
MQTSLARRQRQRRNGAARRGRGGGGSARRAALAIPILLFVSFLTLGVVALIGAVSAYAYYSRDLPDPKTAFDAIAFDQPSIVYDRTGQVQLAVLGANRRIVVTYDQIPPEMIDATTAIEDKDFWSNPGFDLGGFIAAGIDTLQGNPRGGSTITQQLVRARLLPSDAFSGTVYERKIREIIQSIRLTQAFPGQDVKQMIITAYLNQNFYGNQSYGIAAAAKGYFGKSLQDLTLAQFAILAAIPQSPTQYDLVKNATQECNAPLNDDGTCPAAAIQLVVPQDSEIVLRRNKVLDLMETRSTLSGSRHTLQEYEAAKKEPVILAPQGAAPWKAPQFVWQVRSQLGAILCGAASADTCEKVDTGGYRIVTTLDWNMQQVVDKWIYATTRVPTLINANRVLARLGISDADARVILAKLRPTRAHPINIHNAAAGIIDYRTGQVLAYDGSAGYYLPGEPEFDPQFDVLSDGYRQPGSSIKPINYITGLDDGTMTAATMFMDVVTNFGTAAKPYTPTQADHYERGPVRMRQALEFSLNVPSIKAGLINGTDHLFQAMKNFGLSFQTGTVPVVSEAIGTLEVHPIDMISAYGAIANGGILMPRQMILQVQDTAGNVIYPTVTNATPVGRRVASAQASYIITDILAGNTIPSVNPYWADWQILDNGKHRPAAYKTGTTEDTKDVLADGFLAPPADPNAPALVAGVWMGNSNGALTQSLSLDSSALLWSKIMTDVSHGLPMADFKEPSGITTATVDAFSGLLPGPYTTKTINELFIDGTVPTQTDNLHVEVDIDSATGLLWQDGCTGPMIKEGFLDFSAVEPRFPAWQAYTQDWAARAAKGINQAGGPMKTKTMYFYNTSFAPFGRGWGGKFAPTQVCAPVQPPVCAPGTSFDPLATPDPFGSPLPTPCVTPTPEPTPTPAPTSHGGGKPTPTPSAQPPPGP